MTTVLHLGVIEFPYVQRPPVAPKRPSKKPRKARGSAARTETTGDVATFLENRYHIMEIFYEEHAQGVADALAESLAGTLVNLHMGAPIPEDPYLGGQSKIDVLFKQWLSSGAIEQIGIPGVPTKAALEGISHRFKSGIGGRRVSFVDTGLYETSFWAWVV